MESQMTSPNKAASAAASACLAFAAIVLALPVVAATAAQEAPAKGKNPQPDLRIDAAMRREVIEGVLENLKKHYAYPDAARQMDRAIRQRLRKGEYDSIDSGAKLAKVLTGHLQEVREDPHLRVEFTAVPGKPDRPTASTAQTPEERRAEREHWLRHGSSRNFFIDRAERLSGNVGYLRLSAFFFEDMTRETLAAAMTFVAHTDALIIDLRECGGGDVAMATLFVDYFDAKRKNPGVTGKRYVDRDVYVLTSQKIYSAPEGVARALQSGRRAVIVGEKTRGATNITTGFRINKHFAVSVPYTRSGDRAGTDVSRKGVKPDIETTAAAALKTAYLTALKKLSRENVNAEMADERKKTIEALEKK
jgi:C-terminal processing protease CtpA/Prc